MPRVPPPPADLPQPRRSAHPLVTSRPSTRAPPRWSGSYRPAYRRARLPARNRVTGDHRAQERARRADRLHGRSSADRPPAGRGGGLMTASPNTYAQALEVAQREATSPSMDWSGYCQKFVRTTYGIPSLFSSAWTQWLGADAEDRHVGGDPADAPVGSALCYKGSGIYGHIVLAARPFKNGTPAAWSNDLVAWGDIDKVSRTAATSSWGQRYLGYLTAVNDYDLRLRENKPPKPKQDKRYEAIDKAALRLEHALETAKTQADQRDADAIREEINRLRRLYRELRRY